ncbi:MAG: serine hydrolase [Bacteroidetes bacterium]|nr:serine hydrolase [Bacteroidota bacterium]
MARYRTGFILPVLCMLVFLSSTYAQPKKKTDITSIAKAQWVDSIYQKLDDTERIGQLFMVAAYSGGKDYNEEKIKTLISERRIGGLIFMQGTPEAQASLNNLYQQMAQVPLLIAMDAEWGLGMRLTGVANMPHSMMVGATQDTLLAYKLGDAIGKQCRRMGVHIDFAPVVDVNNNPNNPIINARSYGENKTLVAKMALAYMRGLQNNGVMACAKHFPGHGDTDADSHTDLPTIKKSMRQLDTLELYPFKELIKGGVKSIMVAHLEVPALESESHIPTSLSKNVITRLLKNTLGYNGLIFTDALNMQGVTKYFQPGDVDLKAIMAGNDMLLISQDVPVAIQKIKAAIDSGLISREEIETKVRKILAAKYDAGLAHWKAVDNVNATTDLNQLILPIRTEMSKKAVTLVRDRNFIIADLANKTNHVGYVGVNANDSTALSKELFAAYPDLNIQWLPKGSNAAAVNKVLNDLAKNDITIVGIHNMSFYPGSSGNYSLDDQQMTFIKQMASKKNTMLVLMGNAYLLKNTCEVGSVIVAYEDDSISERVAARILLRKEDARGIMPVTPCIDMPTEGRLLQAGGMAGMQKTDALQYIDFAEDAGVTNRAALDKLDMFIQRAIVNGAFPGCRILAAKDGKVFYNKSFGYYTFSKEQPVTDNTIYDVASVTKVLSTNLAVMRLYETGKIDLDKSIGDYLPWVKNTDKAPLKIRDLLLHQAGLKSWIPYYKETVDEKGNQRTDLFSNKPDNSKWIEVAKNLYLRGDYPDTIWNRILTSPLENKGKFVYSDLDFYFLAAIVERITSQHIDKYVDEQFYKPLGLKYITYNPLKKFKEKDITPTENDIFFRHQQLQGYVHDQGAALLGGVAGHAGIFSTANDVAVIFQMLLNNGSYKGKRYFKKETIEKFTAYNTTLSRRGLGFDKPSADKDDAGPAGNRCSGYAFGHQGFTGTCVWADPATGIVFVFLSNRVQPSADNNLINKLSVRTQAQDYIYESLGFSINHERPALYKTQTTQSK